MRIAREQAVDIILSEVLLPDMDGYEMCSRLRADWNTQRIPILLVTSLGGTENRVRGLMAGADDYLMKPYDVRELVIRLRRLISTYSNCYQLNPLTKLPGAQLTRSYIEEVCMACPQIEWALLQIDLNNFKTYNQIYGFPAGDALLRELGDLLRRVVLQAPDANEDFLGHEGADDFLAVVPLNRVEAVCRTIIEGFDKNLRDYYPAPDRINPFQVLVDRTGATKIVPHLGISIGVVTSNLCEDVGYLELREIASTVTNRAKAEASSAFYVNHRQAASRPANPPKSASERDQEHPMIA